MWLFASVVLILAVSNPGVRKLMGGIASIIGIVLFILMIRACSA
jgi:hypothetical protein